MSTASAPEAGDPSEAWRARRADVARRQQRGYVERVRAGRGDLSPEGAFENDARVYTDPARFEREMETIFRNQPILVGLTQDLPEPGSILVFDELEKSIIVVRTKSGEVRGYLNMCPHRAMMLVEEGCQKKRITCPFHGWTFDLDGNLIGVPEPEAFENIDRAARGLVNVPAAEFAGLIFILPRAGDDTFDVKDHLGAFATELEQLELQYSEPVKSGALEVDCNWKYALDTYGEAYHFPVLHKENVALFNTTESLYEPFGPHSRIGWPLREVAELLDKPESEWPEPAYGGVHYLFPNTIIFYGSVGAGEPFVQVFRHFPRGVDAMRTHFAVYGRGAVASDEYRAFIETAGYDGTAHVVETEDYWVAAKGYERLKAAPSGFKVLYGANELSLTDKHRAIA
ncbi:MAG: aromatic ring-hydroxylating dioxygenase subunit alpha, partial [Pseudomonadota bacterium]